jgi:hypothetical protein
MKADLRIAVKEYSPVVVESSPEMVLGWRGLVCVTPAPGFGAGVRIKTAWLRG